MRERGIFWRLSRFRPRAEGLSVEDFFTELWAYTLTRHPLLLDQVAQALGLPASQQWSLDTQVEYGPAPLPGSTMPCRPDLVLMSDEARVLVEHKVDADQHLEPVRHPETGEELAYSQLERYLAVDEEAQLAYVTLVPSRVAPTVLDNPRYLRPADRAHFVWADFHAIVASYADCEGRSDPFVTELVRYMGELEMRPPREGVGMIPSENLPGMKAERASMRQHWQPSIALLERNGWTMGPWGLEIECRRPGQPYPSLFLDMRYGERAEKRDGSLKARLRVLPGSVDADPEVLVRAWREAGHDAAVKKHRTSQKVPVECLDLTCVTRVTRPDYIGDGDPSARLLDFVAEVLQPIHAWLGINEPDLSR